jgi:creatinine amidohydrolase
MGRARLMYEMTVEEVRNGLKENQTVILPVGVVEQHGYHLPLSVDIHNSYESARRASDICGCFVAPSVHYSFSGGMLPGTINISPQTYGLVIMDIFRSLILQGFKNIILLMGHGGTEAIRAANDAVENFQRLNPNIEGITISIVRFGRLSPIYSRAIEDKDFHAGKYETSLMLYWKPELVKMDKARLDTPELVKLMRTDQDAFLNKTKLVDMEYVIPKLTQREDIKVGVMGDFTDASAELGREMAGQIAKRLAEIAERLQRENGAQS